MIYVHIMASKHTKARLHQYQQSHSLQKTFTNLCVAHNKVEDINRAWPENSEELRHIHRL